MARKRDLPPSWWTRREYGRLSDAARLLYLALLSLADDEGRGEDDLGRVKAERYAYAATTVEELQVALEELTAPDEARRQLVRLYEVDGERFYALRDFHRDQRPSHPAPSRLPPPPPVETVGKTPDSTLIRPDPPESGPDAHEPCLELFRIWNEEAHPDLARVPAVSDRRRDLARARWAEHPESAWWRAVVARLNAAVAGGAFQDRPGAASVELLLGPGSADRVLEGLYDPPGTVCPTCRHRVLAPGQALCPDCAAQANRGA